MLASELRRGQQRANGVYLTPDASARALAELSIREPTDTVLDPAVGMGVFVRAARDRLRELGSVMPEQQVFGVDVDPSALVASHAGLAGLPVGHLRHSDFLALTPDQLPSFDVVVGNPPWIGHHSILGRSAATAATVTFNGFSPSGRSSYWAYFVVHALRFLAPQGRLAFLVPWAIIQADYSIQLRRLLRLYFESVRIYAVEERLFDGTDERAAVLIADGFRLGPGTETVRRVPRLDRLATQTADAAPDTGAIPEAHESVSLDAIAKVRIGIVTGANSFFLTNSSAAVTRRLPREYLVPCVSRRRHLKGLEFGKSDLTILSANDEPVYLIMFPPDTDDPGSIAYIDTGFEAGLASRYKCASRPYWFSIADIPAPDALLNYLSGYGPSIAVNTAGVRATNSFYLVDWKERKTDGYSVAAALLSSFGALAAEVNGRVLGGGALKLEPSEVRRIRIPNLKLKPKSRHLVDSALRAGNREIAQALIDNEVIACGLASKADLAAAKAHLLDLRVGRLNPGGNRAPESHS